VFLDLSNSYVSERLAQVGIKCTRVQSCVYTRYVPVEIHTPAHWNLVSRSMHALPPMLPSSSVSAPASPHCLLITKRGGKKSLSVLKILLIFFFACLDAFAKFRRAVLYLRHNSVRPFVSVNQLVSNGTDFDEI